MADNDDDRRSPFRLARDLYGRTLGATDKKARQLALEDWRDLDEGEQSFMTAQLLYLTLRGQAQILRAQQETNLLLASLERLGVRHDIRAGLPDDDDDEGTEPDEEGAPGAMPETVEEGEEAAPPPPPARPVPPPAGMVPKGTTSQHPLARTCPECGSLPANHCVDPGGTIVPFHEARKKPPPASPAELLTSDGTPVQ